MTLRNVAFSKNQRRREKEAEEALKLIQSSCKHENKDYDNHEDQAFCLDCGKDVE